MLTSGCAPLCVSSPGVVSTVPAGMFQRVMQQLYSNEWLSEEAILAWNEDTSDEVRRFETMCCSLSLCARFVFVVSASSLDY